MAESAKGRPGEKRNRPGKAGMQRTKQEETGKGLDAIKKAEAAFPGHPLQQLDHFLANLKIDARTGRSRKVGRKTGELYKRRMRAIIRELPRIGMHLQNLSHFSPKQARALTDHYVAKGASAATIQNYATVMRRFLIWMGKTNSLPQVSEFVADAVAVRRSYVATAPKTLAAAGFDRQRLYQVAREEVDEIFAAQLELAIEFGLRAKEMCHIRPAESDKVVALHVFRGTKNGHERHVQIATESQRRALERAKEVAANSRDGTLTWPRLTWEQVERRLRYYAEKVGLTKEGEFHTTIHGLRHEFANDLYFRLSGHLSPVVSGLPVDPAIDAPTRLEVSRQMGHQRGDVVVSYCGSNAQVRTAAHDNQYALDRRFKADVVRQTLERYGITCLRLVGKVAEGAMDPKADTLCCYEGALTTDEMELADLQALLAETVGSRVFLTPLTDALRAREDGLEVF